MMFRTHKRAFAFAPLLAAVALTTACDDDPVAPPDPAEDLAIVRLLIGEDTVDITDSAGGSVNIPQGEADVSATFLDADENELAIPSSEFELRFDSEDTDVVTFTRSSAFAGSLTGVAPGSAIVKVTLWHLEEDHGDFGPRDLAVTVQ